MVVWPGDAPFERLTTLELAKGDACNLSQISTTAHIGTHVDAPLHFLAGAGGIETMPISACVGPARVIEIHDPEAVRASELEPHEIANAERIILKTRNTSECWDSDHFRKKFIYIHPDAAHYLVDRGIQTVGIDYLSVDAYDNPNAETHRILLGAGVWIIEGLRLDGVSAGRYELLCLPLKMIGSDGAPARAVLRNLNA